MDVDEHRNWILTPKTLCSFARNSRIYKYQPVEYRPPSSRVAPRAGNIRMRYPARFPAWKSKWIPEKFLDGLKKNSSLYQIRKDLYISDKLNFGYFFFNKFG